MMRMIRKICRSRHLIGLFVFTLLVLGFGNLFRNCDMASKRVPGPIQDQVHTHVIYRAPEPRNTTSVKGAPFLIPKDDELAKLSESDHLTIYWKYINTVQILCRNQTRVGSLDDGGKEVCVDDAYKPSKPCIVYSFGSNFQFDFDVPMHNFYGCDVFTFDPSMHINARKLPQEIKFELRGLSHKDWINEKKWKMATLETILKDNKHENSVIDILKIDIEGGEWKALPPIVNAGIFKRVKQLLIEIHAGRMGPNMDKGFWGEVDLAGQLRVLRLLYECGFRIFMREHNMNTVSKFAVPPQSKITITNEISLINVDFL